jgi:hypothetical protein
MEYEKFPDVKDQTQMCRVNYRKYPRIATSSGKRFDPEKKDDPCMDTVEKESDTDKNRIDGKCLKVKQKASD